MTKLIEAALAPVIKTASPALNAELIRCMEIFRFDRGSAERFIPWSDRDWNCGLFKISCKGGRVCRICPAKHKRIRGSDPLGIRLYEAERYARDRGHSLCPEAAAVGIRTNAARRIGPRRSGGQSATAHHPYAVRQPAAGAFLPDGLLGGILFLLGQLLERATVLSPLQLVVFPPLT